MERFGTAAGGWLGTAAEPSARGRSVALIVLLIAAVIAMRGYLPGSTADPPPRETPTGGGPGLIIVAALLAVALGVIAVAVAAQLRNRGAPQPAPADRDIWRRGGIRRPRWRAVLLIGGVLVGYLMLVSAVARLVGRWGPDAPVADPAASPASPGETLPPPPPPDDQVWPYLYAATAVFLLLVAVGSVAARRRTRQRDEPGSVRIEQPPAPRHRGTPESLARAAEVGLVEIGDPDREPREAIIACYVAMEAELAQVPEAAPQRFDTASEVLARAVEHHALSAGTATPLVDLFGEARFSRHLMREEHRQAAVRALQQVLDELRSPV